MTNANILDYHLSSSYVGQFIFQVFNDDVDKDYPRKTNTSEDSCQRWAQINSFLINSTRWKSHFE